MPTVILEMVNGETVTELLQGDVWVYTVRHADGTECHVGIPPELGLTEGQRRREACRCSCEHMPVNEWSGSPTPFIYTALNPEVLLCQP